MNNDILTRLEFLEAYDDARRFGSFCLLRDIITGEVYEVRLKRFAEYDPIRELAPYFSIELEAIQALAMEWPACSDPVSTTVRKSDPTPTSSSGLPKESEQLSSMATCFLTQSGLL